MILSGPAQRLTVILGEDDMWHHRPVYTEIVHRAHRAGLAGASGFRGVEGFGPPAGPTAPASCPCPRTFRSRS